jgi:surfactin synthase thioesterase subunit
VQVLPVELPGHGTRIKEPCCTDLVALSRQAVDALTGTFT